MCGTECIPATCLGSEWPRNHKHTKVQRNQESKSRCSTSFLCLLFFVFGFLFFGSFLFCFVLFSKTQFLCVLLAPETHFIDQAGLKLCLRSVGTNGMCHHRPASSAFLLVHRLQPCYIAHVRLSTTMHSSLLFMPIYQGYSWILLAQSAHCERALPKVMAC